MPNEDQTSGPSPDSDFRRLGHWLLVVGTVAVVLVGLLVLAMLFLGSTDVPESVAIS